MTTMMMLVMFTVMLQCYCNWKKNRMPGRVNHIILY